MARAFYSEFDPYAASWLRNLIAAGKIADGDVDERDLWDVCPDELRQYTQVHLCAGLGLWSYALRRAGWSDDRPIWTASFPCQPFSAAGKGLGFDDERHLWPAGAHLISQCRPSVICGEQVASKDGYAWRDIVQTDMEGLGYAFWACVLPIAGVGGPGERHRQWWVGIDGSDEWACSVLDTACGLADAAHDHGWRGERGAQAGIGVLGVGWRGFAGGGADSSVADDNDAGRSEQRAPYDDGGSLVQRHDIDGRGAAGRLVDSAGERCGETGRADPTGGQPIVFADSGSGVGGLDVAEQSGLERHAGDGDGATGREAAHGSIAETSLYGGLADTQGGGFGVGGHETQPGDSRYGGGESAHDSGRPGPLNGFWRNADWLFCTDGRWRPVESQSFPLAYGLPLSMGKISPGLAGLCTVAGVDKDSLKRAKAYRVGTLKGYGNAISPEPAIVFILSWRDIAP